MAGRADAGAAAGRLRAGARREPDRRVRGGFRRPPASGMSAAPIRSRPEPADLAPAGLILADLGSPRQEGAARAVERAAPEVRTGDDGSVPEPATRTPGLCADLDVLLRDRVPHLALRTGEAIGVVGPLVRPGRSACLSCVDLRKNRKLDPEQPGRRNPRPGPLPGQLQPQACDTVLAAMTATLAAAQALAFLDPPAMAAVAPMDAPPVRAARLAVAPGDGGCRTRRAAAARPCGGFATRTALGTGGRLASKVEGAR